MPHCEANPDILGRWLHIPLHTHHLLVESPFLGKILDGILGFSGMKNQAHCEPTAKWQGLVFLSPASPCDDAER